MAEQSKGETEGKGRPTPPAPQNRRDLKVPGPIFRTFSHEMDFGVVKRENEIGDLPLMQIAAGMPGGGICIVEFPAGFVPQVITGMKAAFDQWCDENPATSAELRTRAAAAAAGIEVPVIEVPHDLRGEDGGKS